MSLISNLNKGTDGTSSESEWTPATKTGSSASGAEDGAESSVGFSIAGAIVPTNGTGSTTSSQAAQRYVRVSILRAPKFIKFYWLGNGQGIKNPTSGMFNDKFEREL